MEGGGAPCEHEAGVRHLLVTPRLAVGHPLLLPLLTASLLFFIAGGFAPCHACSSQGRCPFHPDLIGASSALFTATSQSPANTLGTLVVEPPASHEAPVTHVGGAIGLSWSASPTAATRSVGYLVLRRPSGTAGFALVAGPLDALSHVDVPPTDGLYDYVIRAAIASFTSADSAMRTGESRR